MGWTDERITTLKTLWLSGRKPTYIAGELGGVTVDAVIGKLNRLGFRGEKAQQSALYPRRKKPQPLPESVPQPARFHEPSKPRIPIRCDALGNEEPFEMWTEEPPTCKWPIGDPLAESFSLCGKGCKRNRPYCDEHMRRSSPKPSAQKMRDRTIERLAGHFSR